MHSVIFLYNFCQFFPGGKKTEWPLEQSLCDTVSPISPCLPA